MKDTGTITITELVTVHLEGYEPIKDLRKVSEWNGMWELRDDKGCKVIISVNHEPFGGLFADVFGTERKPREVRVISVTPSLLVPIPAAAGPTTAEVLADAQAIIDRHATYQAGTGGGGNP